MKKLIVLLQQSNVDNNLVKLEIESPEALDQAVPRVLEFLAGRRKIALYGEMGAGKTTFVKAFCRYMGVAGNTASPTFSLVNDYSYTDENSQPAVIHHLDLYRLNTLEEALDIGLEDLLYDPFYCIIEWPQLAEAILPLDCAKIHIEITGPNTRQIVLL